MLLDSKADARVQSGYGATTLHFAAARGDRKMVRLLARHVDMSELDDLNSMVPDDIKIQLRLKQCSCCAKY